MKIIQKAKFYQSGTTSSRATTNADLHLHDGRSDVIQPAIIDLDGFNFSSAVPKTAAEAAKINDRIEEWEKCITGLLTP